MTVVANDRLACDRPHFWDIKRKRNDEAAFQKVKILMKLEKNKAVAEHLSDNLERYSLGTVRTIEDFFKHTGIDPVTGLVHKNFCRPETGYKNEDNLSYNATKGPVRRLIEGFASEGQPVPAFAEVDAWRDFRTGRMSLTDPREDDDDLHTWKVILVLWFIAATVAAWIWYAKHGKW